VSIGVACIIPDARAIHQDLLGAADRALFDAKQAAATASSRRGCRPASSRRAWWRDVRPPGALHA
jgi:GGDEF domain-containing protein